jgi:signal transduction histidine kinase
MGTVQGSNIKTQLMLVIVFTSFLSLMLCGLGFIIYEYTTIQDRMGSNLQTLASVVGTNSSAALSFRDPEDARHVLSTLDSRTDVREAAIFDNNGAVLSSFVRPGTARTIPLAPGVDGWKMTGTTIVVFEPVEFQGRRIGTVYIRAGLEAMYERFRNYAGIVGVVLALSLLASVIIATRLQRRISYPILGLASTARRISLDKDYSIRAVADVPGEIGTLAAAFNAMLEQIQKNEVQLRDYNASLTVEIAERKRAEEALQRAHDELEEKVRERSARLVDIERKRAEDLRHFADSVQQAQEDERRRIARELHDGICQSLSAMKLNAEVLEDHIEVKNREVNQRFRSLTRQCEDLIVEVRRMSANLRPSHLDDFGIVVALNLLAREFQKEHGISINVEMNTSVRMQLAPQIEIAVYRICQEALNNIAKHARATTVRMSFQKENDAVVLQVADNGRGFEIAEAERRRDARHGLGLMGMRERVELLGGTFGVTTAPGEGTTIAVRLPLELQGEREAGTNGQAHVRGPRILTM